MTRSVSRSAPGLAALALLAGGVLIASCRDGAKDGGPGPALSLEIALRAPGTQTVTALCTAAARAVLVTIDDDADPVRTFRFLFSTTGQLYGCGGAACTTEESVLQTALVDPQKVSVEVIDVPPEQFVPPTSYNVLCRGVADVRLGTDLTIVGTSLRARVKMLRVGGINPLFDGTTDHPTSEFLAGSPLRATPASGSLARTSSGGGIVFAGGFDATTKVGTDAIHRFDPLTLSLRAAPVTMQDARGGLTATAIEGPLGESLVLFAGGASSTTATSFSEGELYDPRTQELTSIPLYRARSGHSAVYLPQYDDGGGGTARPAVVLLGGCAVGMCAGGPDALGETGSLEAFYLDPPLASTGASCISVASGEGSCTFSFGEGASCGTNCTTPGRSLAAAGPLKGPGSDLYFGHGYAGSDAVNGGLAASNLVDGHTFGNYLEAPLMYRTFAPATASLGTAQLLVVGGFTIANGAQDNAVLLTPVGAGFTPTMRLKRGAPTATTLLDGRVVIAGGNTGFFLGATVFTNSVEIFDLKPTPDFALLARRGETCTAPGDVGCETMAQPRGGHAAVRIDGSLSWVNGAVVFAGGRPLGGTTSDPEIFVPAYDCAAGAIPSALQGQIDFCDRGRIAVTPTDPRTP